jgi:hypothetical protein
MIRQGDGAQANYRRSETLPVGSRDNSILQKIHYRFITLPNTSTVIQLKILISCLHLRERFADALGTLNRDEKMIVLAADIMLGVVGDTLAAWASVECYV